MVARDTIASTYSIQTDEEVKAVTVNVDKPARGSAPKEVVTLEESDKCDRITLWSFGKPYMRGFHLAWLAFFVAFTAWFAVAPLNTVIKKSLKLQKKHILYANMSSVSSTVIARLMIGPLTDKYGPKRAMAVLLLLGALPVYCLGFIKSWKDLVTVRAMVGILGASFVPCQTWTTMMFQKSVVGTANAIVGGWGNLGGGFTQFFMVEIYSSFMGYGMTSEQAWRNSFIVPALMLVATAGLCYFLGTDTPKGDIKDLKKRGYVPKKASSSMGDAIRQPATWLLALQYAMSFGVELVVFNMAEMYFHEKFKVSTVKAGHVAALGGIGNIFTRASGGIISDLVNAKYMMKGRLGVQMTLLVLEGSLLLWFSYAQDFTSACVLLLTFSVFVQAANGSCFGIVPYVNAKSMGSISGIVGAGGNIGGMMFSLMFVLGKFHSIADGFRIMGWTVLVVSLTTFFIVPAESDLNKARDMESTMHEDSDYRV